MKGFIAIATLALVAIASAQLLGDGLGHGHGHHHQHHHGHHDVHHHDHHHGWGWSHPAYKFSYGVSDKHTGDVKSASEWRDGHVTKGHYSLVQPDGVLRTVHYVVDGKSGFKAHVVNKGIAHHHHHHHGHGHHGGLGGPAGILG